MTNEIVDPSELLQAEYELQVIELRREYAAATTRRERSKVRRRMRRLRRHIMSGPLGDGQVIRW